MRKKTVIGLSLCVAAAAAMVAMGQTGGPYPPGAPGQPAYGIAVFDAKDGGPQREGQMNRKVGECVQQYLAAKDDDARRTARDKLQSALGDLFDLRQKEREDEIKEIETRVSKLRETLKKRESKRQELIEHHLTTLIQDAEGLGWGSDGQNRDVFYYRTPMMTPGGARVIETRPVPAPELPGVAPRRE
ncbi:MAG TPA: hypothetical protein VKB78_07625 [Pirellulales bacterium]|nr:hypothetical protein [Pirellulales bacterium]